MSAYLYCTHSILVCHRTIIHHRDCNVDGIAELIRLYVSISKCLFVCAFIDCGPINQNLSLVANGDRLTSGETWLSLEKACFLCVCVCVRARNYDTPVTVWFSAWLLEPPSFVLPTLDEEAEDVFPEMQRLSTLIYYFLYAYTRVCVCVNCVNTIR